MRAAQNSTQRHQFDQILLSIKSAPEFSHGLGRKKSFVTHKTPTPCKGRYLSQPRSGCAPSAGQDGPLLYPGPLCGGEAGPTGRAAGTDRLSVPFRQYMEVLSKSPAPTHGLAAHGWAASAKRGGLLFWLLFSWPRKRKVTRLPQAVESRRLENLAYRASPISGRK